MKQFEMLYNYLQENPDKEVWFGWGSGKVIYFWDNGLKMWFTTDWLGRTSSINYINNEEDFYKYSPARKEVTLHYVKRESENQWTHYCETVEMSINNPFWENIKIAHHGYRNENEVTPEVNKRIDELHGYKED